MRKFLVFLTLSLLASHFCGVVKAGNTEISVGRASDQEILGTVFSTSEDGHLLKIRVYCSSSDPNDHSVRVWTKDGNNFTLTYGPYLWALPTGTTGWQEFEFPVPLPVLQNVTYFISIGYIPTLSGNTDNTTNELNVSERTSSEDVYAQNAGATLPTSWFISNSKRIEVILSIRFKACVIQSDQMVCYNTNPEPLVQKEPPTGGTGLYTYKWQSSTDSITWQDIPDAKYSSFAPPAIIKSTWYRCVVTSGAFGSKNSNPVLMTVLNPLMPGSIGKSQTICYNTAPSLMSVKTDPTGGEGLYSYIWQSSTDDVNWTDIPGANSRYYQPDNLVVTTWFRRIVSSGNCDRKISNEVQIKVIDFLDPGTIGSPQTICYNSVPAGLTSKSSPAGGTGIYEYQWQWSVDNSHWTNIPGATRLTYAPPAMTESTWFRRQIVNDTCNIKSSNSVLISINAALSAPVIGPAQEICYNSVPAGLTQVTPPAGGSGSFTYQWQISVNNSTWSNIAGATTGSYYPAALTSTTWYRCNVTSNECGTVSSNTVQVTVYRAFSAGTIGTSQSICTGETPAALAQLTAPSGADGSFSLQWQNSVDNSTWTNIAGASSQNFAPPALTSNSWYRYSVTSNKCGSINSNVITVTVNPALTAGTIGSDQTICFNSAPAALTQVSAPSGGTGTYSYQWQSSSDNIVWSDISGGTLAGYSPGPLTGETWFRRNVRSGDCKMITSNSVDIRISPVINPGTIGAAQTVCYGSTPAPLTQAEAPSGGTGSYAFQWQTSANNTTWADISGATSASFSPPALTTSTWYRRNVTSGSCGPAYGTAVSITIIPQLTSGSIGTDQSICYNDIPASLTQVSPPAGGTGIFSYQWQSSGDNSTWVNIPGATLSGYSPPALTLSTWYRRTVTSGSCGTANSGSVHITVYPALSPGSIGTDQAICYNTVPSRLNQLTAPAGGTGTYSYQWQRSPENSTWANIQGATSSSYSPQSLTSTTWFRRIAYSGGCSASSASVNITVLHAITLAQLHDTKRITPGTSTTINITIDGGAPPFTVNYNINGTAQPAIINYTSGSGFSTGILNEGNYIYTLTSVTDANGCSAQSLGSSIIITASSSQTTVSNIALVLVNSGSNFYPDYYNYIQPYLDNFGIPYEVCDIATTALPDLTKYSIIIFGHQNVYQSGYPIAELETAIYAGTGLYSFDPHLFDFTSAFNNLIPDISLSSSQIIIPNYSHYITRLHAPDSYSPSNNVINLLSSWSLHQNSNLTGGVNLATMTSGGQTIALLQVTSYGSGRIVKWCGYDWVFESMLGPVYGMDDLIWRGIVWAAKKPFIMQGMPPFLTMRVDDVDGTGTEIENNFAWVSIANEFGIIPWLSTFINNIPVDYIPTLRYLINSGLATSSPHAYGYSKGYNGFIYYNHDNMTTFDAAANVRDARNYYISNGLAMSNYVVPHYYEYASAALAEIKNMGVDFIGVHWLPDLSYSPAPSWLNCGPYRINRNGTSSTSDARPVYYGGYVNLSGVQFFNCLTEIRDDGGYEWFPDNSVSSTAARGIRHLRRSFNSMVLASLFTHEQTWIANITPANWRSILSQVTSGVAAYNPEYTSMDYAVKYIRAKSNLHITNVVDNSTSVDISYSGNNDMTTRCYLFTEQGGAISSTFVSLPQISGSSTISVLK